MEMSPIVLILAAAVFIVVFVYIFRDASLLDFGLLAAAFAIIGTMLSMCINVYNGGSRMTFYEENMLILMMAFLYLYMTSFSAKYTLKFNLTK